MLRITFGQIVRGLGLSAMMMGWQVVPASAASTYPGINGRIIYTDTNNFPGGYSLVSIKPDGTAPLNVGTPGQTKRMPSISKDGTMLTYVQSVGSDWQIAIAKTNGTNPTLITSGSDGHWQPSFSPNGTKIVYMEATVSGSSIKTMNLDGSAQTLVYTTSYAVFSPSYSPDGSKILFSAAPGGNNEILSMNADGTGVVNLTNSGGHETDPVWSPDGSTILYSYNTGGSFRIKKMNADGSGQADLTDGSSDAYAATFSPDGTKIAFAMYNGTVPEVYTMNPNGTGVTKLTTNGWPAEISWQPLSLTPQSSNPNPSVSTKPGSPAVVDVDALYTDPYGAMNPASVTVTSTSPGLSASVNSTTGEITITQAKLAQNASLLARVMDHFVPRAEAANGSVGYRVCSSADATLCATGTIGVVLASATLADTGTSQQLPLVVGLFLLLAGMLGVRRRVIG